MSRQIGVPRMLEGAVHEDASALGYGPRRTRTYCDDCLPHYQHEQYKQAFHGSGLAAIEETKESGADPTHGSTAAARRAEANVTRKRQAREWDEFHGKVVDLSAFQRDILPLIQGVPLSRLQRATGLSLRYVSLIRRASGRRIRATGRRFWEWPLPRDTDDYRASNRCSSEAETTTGSGGS